MSNSHSRFIGWSAYISAIAFVLVIITISIFFAIGGFWGTVNDVLAVVQFVSLLPVIYGLYVVHDRKYQSFNSLLVLVGVASITTATILQLLLITKVVPFVTQYPLVLASMVVWAVWLIAISALSMKMNTLSRWTNYFGILTAISYLLLAYGFYTGGQTHPLVSVGFLISLVTYIGWCRGVGRTFLSQSS